MNQREIELREEQWNAQRQRALEDALGANLEYWRAQQPRCKALQQKLLSGKPTRDTSSHVPGCRPPWITSDEPSWNSAPGHLPLYDRDDNIEPMANVAPSGPSHLDSETLDLIKRDANYAYILSEGTLGIATLDPPRVISVVPIGARPKGLILDGDRLVVFSALDPMTKSLNQLFPLGPSRFLSVSSMKNHTDARGITLQHWDATAPEPRLLFESSFGDEESSSEVLVDPLALTYDSERGLLALPMTICGRIAAATGEKSAPFSGLRLYRVEGEARLESLGSIEHNGRDTVCARSNRPSLQVKRSFFVGDRVWSIASPNIKVRNLAELDTDIAELTLE